MFNFVKIHDKNLSFFFKNRYDINVETSSNKYYLYLFYKSYTKILKSLRIGTDNTENRNYKKFLQSPEISEEWTLNLQQISRTTGFNSFQDFAGKINKFH